MALILTLLIMTVIFVVAEFIPMLVMEGHTN